jgi:hypothetical protein
MAQQAQHLPVFIKPANLDYLDKPSESHSFLASVILGVLATWGITLYLAFSFAS